MLTAGELVGAFKLSVALAVRRLVVVMLLEQGNRAVREVVHHQPGNGDIRFHRGRYHRHIAAKGAIANQGQHYFVGCAYFSPQGRCRAKAHGGKAAGGDKSAGNGNIELLSDPVFVPTDIGDNQPVFR